MLKNSLDTYDTALIDKFNELVSSLRFNSHMGDNFNNYYAVFDEVKNKMAECCRDIDYVVDNLVIYLFSNPKKTKKRAFWIIYGDVVYEHLKENLDEKTYICQSCGKRFYRLGKYKVHCPNCVKHHKATKKKNVITCVDCGKKVQLSPKSRNRIRCDDCLAAYKLKLNRQRQQRFRDKNNVGK